MLTLAAPGRAAADVDPEPDHLHPGSDTPVNPFHTRELNAAELRELLETGGFRVDGLYGVFPAPG